MLKLGSSNVKALFRRGQARLAQGMLLDAQQGAFVIPAPFCPAYKLLTSGLSDFNSALKLEPNNASIRDELKKAEQAIAVEKSKVRPSLRPRFLRGLNQLRAEIKVGVCSRIFRKLWSTLKHHDFRTSA